MLQEHDIAEAARHVVAARSKHVCLSPFPPDLRPTTEAEAYRIQALQHERLAAMGLGGLAGFKVGATTQAMQEKLGLTSPAAGGVFANNVRYSGVCFPPGAFFSPGVECEIAVIMGDNLPGRRRAYRREDVARAVRTVHAAIEILDRRFTDAAAMPIASLIADDLMSGAIVLGPPVAWDVDLAEVRGTMFVNNKSVGSGLGREILGHPYEVLAWLANLLTEQGRPLREGQIVMCGSVFPPVWLSPEESRPLEVRVEYPELGEVRATLS